MGGGGAWVKTRRLSTCVPSARGSGISIYVAMTKALGSMRAPGLAGSSNNNTDFPFDFPGPIDDLHEL